MLPSYTNFALWAMLNFVIVHVHVLVLFFYTWNFISFITIKTYIFGLEEPFIIASTKVWHTRGAFILQTICNNHRKVSNTTIFFITDSMITHILLCKQAFNDFNISICMTSNFFLFLLYKLATRFLCFTFPAAEEEESLLITLLKNSICLFFDRTRRFSLTIFLFIELRKNCAEFASFSIASITLSIWKKAWSRVNTLGF